MDAALSTADAVSRATVAWRVLAVACLSLAAGCGGGSDSGAVTGTAASGPSGGSVARPADNLLTAAVAVDGSTAAAALRFEVLERPLPGMPFTVRLQLQPTQTLTLLQADLLDSAGIRRLSPPNLLRLVGAAATGNPERTVSLQADAAGIYEVAVAVRTESTGGAGLSRFVLPVLVEPAPTAQPGR